MIFRLELKAALQDFMTWSQKVDRGIRGNTVPHLAIKMAGRSSRDARRPRQNHTTAFKAKVVVCRLEEATYRYHLGNSPTVQCHSAMRASLETRRRLFRKFQVNDLNCSPSRLIICFTNRQPILNVRNKPSIRVL